MPPKRIISLLSVFIIFAASGLEVLMLSVWKNKFGIFWSPLITLGSGLVVGVGFLIFSYQKISLLRFEEENRWRHNSTITKKILTFIIALLGIWKTGHFLKHEIRNFPVNFYDPEGSDVIPQIGIMVDRFLHGIFPYKMITEWTLDHALYPTYLPMTWMPFLISEVFQFDYRWLAFGVLMIGFLFFFKKMLDWGLVGWKIIVVGGFSFYLLHLFQLGDNEGVFRYSVETLIAGYYLIFALSIFTKSNFLKGAALTLCLLSRYSVVLWVPLFFFVLFFNEKKSDLVKIGLVMLVGFLAFYFFPFLMQDFSIFLKGYDYHTDGAIQAWKVQPWQGDATLPYNLFKGFGMAGFFYQYVEGNLAEKVHTCQQFHFWLSAVTVIFS
ncbi:MAG: hypothetical protein AAF573_03650, partial [Bacteroidota bacterium]